MHVTPSIFSGRILGSEALLYKSYFFQNSRLRKLFDIRLSYKHCNFSLVYLLVKMASKTVTRSIVFMGDSKHELSTINMLFSLKQNYTTTSKTTTSPQWPLSFVRKEAVVERFDITVIPSIIFGVILKGGICYTRDIKFGMSGIRTRSSSSAQGSEEMCLSLCTSHLFPPLPHPRNIAGEFANKRC